MNRLLIILCVGFMVFSCKSKKAAVAKGSDASSEKIDAKQNGVKSETKVYADNSERYIDMHKGTAQQEMKLYGIPASITLAQGILESGSGQGRLALEANNHFGIKCHEWTGGKIYHDDDEKQECFRKYVDAKYSFRDHSLFLTERSRYSKLFDLNKKDYTGWARGLRSAGYATDKLYPQKLIYIIERYRLYKLDEEVLAENRGKEKTPKVEVLADGHAKNERPVSAGREVYTVSKGDTQYSISKKYNLTVKELQNLNGLSSTSLNVGQVLVVIPKGSGDSMERKVVKGDSSTSNESKVSKDKALVEKPVKKETPVSVGREVHAVSKGDTQYSISKKYNLTVKELQDLNGLSNTNLSIGQILVVIPKGSGDSMEHKVVKGGSSTSNKNKVSKDEDLVESPVKKETPASVGRKVHTVSKGDTQYSISKKYNLTVKELQNLNGLSNTNLSIGQVLVVKPSSKN